MRPELKASDVPYRISIGTPSFTGDGWDKTVIVTAKVVGSDGIVREEEHSVELGFLKATSRTVHIRWSYSHLTTPDSPVPEGTWRTMGRNWKEQPLPKKGANSRTTFPRLVRIADRLNFVVCPQHRLFGVKEAKDLAEFVHNFLIVNQVMSD